MRFDHPTPDRVGVLRMLWKQAFGDEDAFLDAFFSTGFSPERCRCALEGERLAAALYWLDCELEGRKIAYVYAVATDRAYRGRGICHGLMADAHGLLEARGYSGAVLVPGDPTLWSFYETMGYRPCTQIRTIYAHAGQELAALRPIRPDEYARLRRERLPQGGVIQEGAALAFLATQAAFYAGDDLLLVARREAEELFALELLGDTAPIGGIVTALGAQRGRFRCPGAGERSTMYRSFDGSPAPNYFAFAFD